MFGNWNGIGKAWVLGSIHSLHLFALLIHLRTLYIYFVD